jgi:hypothetical protein
VLTGIHLSWKLRRNRIWFEWNISDIRNSVYTDHIDLLGTDTSIRKEMYNIEINAGLEITGEQNN